MAICCLNFTNFSTELTFMKRRELLRYTAYATGATISAPLLSTLLSGCSEVDSTPGTQKFFGNQDFAILKDLVDTILPKTDSPSASDVGVHYTIDAMVGSVYKEEDRIAYKKGFSWLVKHLGDGDFANLPSDEKVSLLQNIEKESDQEDVKKAYVDLKQQAIAYYLSTEEVAKNYLNYLLVPGEYESCISLDEVGGKAWAL